MGDLVLELCFQSTSKAKSNLKPIVLDEIMEAHREKVTELVLRESAGPVEHSKLYDKYSFLINKQVSLYRNQGQLPHQQTGQSL